MINSGSGNNFANDDFLRVLLAVKDSTMRATNVAEICKISLVNDDTYNCEILTTKESIQCIALQNLELEVDDVVLVIFTNTDFRSTLKKVKQNNPTQVIEDKVLHTKDNGVIVGLVYREENL